MKVEDDTGVLPVGDPEHGRDAPPLVDHGPWGAETVPLGKDDDWRSSTENIRYAANKPRRWIVLAAVACAVGLIAALGMDFIDGKSGIQAERPQTAQARRQPMAYTARADRTKTARRAAHRRRQARLGLRQRSAHLHHPTHPTPSPTYAPAPQPALTPEPVTPSPAPAPAPSPTTKSPPASGAPVASEFGFER